MVKLGIFFIFISVFEKIWLFQSTKIDFWSFQVLVWLKILVLVVYQDAITQRLHCKLFTFYGLIYK